MNDTSSATDARERVRQMREQYPTTIPWDMLEAKAARGRQDSMGSAGYWNEILRLAIEHDDMVTVTMMVRVTAKVSRREWAATEGTNSTAHVVRADVQNYLTHNVIVGWGSSHIAGMDHGSCAAEVVARPHTQLVLEGRDLFSLAWSLTGSRPRPEADHRLRMLRIEPRPDGLAYKVNEGGWSPTVGKRVPAE